MAKNSKRRRARITVGHTPDGKPIRKYVSGYSKSQIDARIKEIKRTYIGGEKVEREEIFGQFISDWFEVYKKPNVRISQAQNLAGIINNHLMPKFAERQLRAITAMDLQRFMNSKKGYGRTFITDTYGILINVFRRAYAQGIIDRDPSVGLEKPQTKRKLERRELTDAESLAALNVARSHKYGVMIYLLYYTGCRPGEMLGFQWGDVDYEMKIIHVERDVDFKLYGIGDVKTESSIRDIPMPRQLVRFLKEFYLTCGRPGAREHIVQALNGGLINNDGTYDRIWRSLMADMYALDPSIEPHPPSKTKKGTGENVKSEKPRSVLTAYYFRHNYASLPCMLTLEGRDRREATMHIGEIIRKHRKEQRMTQEEMARRLGVTAPAVNKWENGHSHPDIALLSALARLLNLSLDTLLSHEKGLSEREANRLVEQAQERLKAEPFESVFAWIKQCVQQYPNCPFLLLWMARILDGHLLMAELPAQGQAEAFVLDCYERVLESDDVKLQGAAAESLYYFHLNKGQYEKAEKALAYLSEENPERKRKQAVLCSKTGRQEEAYRMVEELLYTGYRSLSMTFQDLYLLALQENDRDKAHQLVDKQAMLARLFEFGDYHEISPALELATMEKDEANTLAIMSGMLHNLASIAGFASSPLYAHMTFKPVDELSLAEVRESLLEGFRDEQRYGYMKENEQWRQLVGLSPL